MAEEKKVKKDHGKWFREMRSELKKVVWPDRKTVMKNTGTVLLCSLAIGVCIWIFDFVMVTAVLTARPPPRTPERCCCALLQWAPASGSSTAWRCC